MLLNELPNKEMPITSNIKNKYSDLPLSLPIVLPKTITKQQSFNYCYQSSITKNSSHHKQHQFENINSCLTTLKHHWSDYYQSPKQHQRCGQQQNHFGK